jgi:hypothetical protein
MKDPFIPAMRRYFPTHHEPETESRQDVRLRNTPPPEPQVVPFTLSASREEMSKSASQRLYGIAQAGWNGSRESSSIAQLESVGLKPASTPCTGIHRTRAAMITASRTRL